MERKFANGVGWIEAGTGEPVIFLHAMAGSADAWRPQIEAMKDSYRCIAWDMPGFGESADVGAENMDAVSDRLAEFCAACVGDTPVHFVGLSVGGMLLQTHAVRHAEQVRSLAILDSSPKFGLGGDITPEAFLDPILADLGEGASVRTFSEGMCRAIMGPKRTDAQFEQAVDAMARARLSGLRLTGRLIAMHDGLDKLPQIKAPTLAMAGEDDSDTPPSYAERIAKDIPNGRYEIIPAAGHISNIENPEAVTKALLGFFATLN